MRIKMKIMSLFLVVVAMVVNPAMPAEHTLLATAESVSSWRQQGDAGDTVSETERNNGEVQSDAQKRTSSQKGKEPAERMSDEEWRKSPTGSAGVLEGKSVMISIFVSDKDSKWTKKQKEKANRKVKSAVKYIGRQAKKYGKKTELVADINSYKKICYSYQTKMKINDSGKKQDKLYRKIEKFIDRHIDLTKIRELYQTESIGFLLHINKPGVSSTLVHYVEDGDNNFYECSSLFSRYEGMAEGASTYAHEMMHMFGARDLYEASLSDGITASFVRYMEKKYPNDIMYSTYTMDGRMLKYTIKNEVSRVTAYFLGWLPEIQEQKKYPLAQMEQQGCFYDGTALPNSSDKQK